MFYYEQNTLKPNTQWLKEAKDWKRQHMCCFGRCVCSNIWLIWEVCVIVLHSEQWWLIAVSADQVAPWKGWGGGGASPCPHQLFSLHGSSLHQQHRLCPLCPRPRPSLDRSRPVVVLVPLSASAHVMLLRVCHFLPARASGLWTFLLPS